MKCIATPNNLEVLIHCHVCPMVHPRISAPAVRDALKALEEAGLIERSDRHYETTAKGAFYLNHLLAQPIPVESFSIPGVKP